MTVFEKLLDNYWFVKDINEEEYNNVKKSIDDQLQMFIKNKLGYKLIINPYVIKLEKLPGIPKSFMGIEEFESNLDYLFLCLVLMFLEEKTRKEQFILSQLLDYIQNAIVQIDVGDIVIDFTIYSQRKSMVRVLKYIKEMGFIKLYDGEENKFMQSVDNDILYETTGVSKYFMRNFPMDILKCETYNDIYVNEYLGLEQDKGMQRKQRIYRRLFLENVIYKESVEDQDYLYIRNYRNVIKDDVDKMLDSTLEIYKNGAYILLAQHKNLRNTFPGSRAITDFVLFLCSDIKDKLTSGEYEIESNDCIQISEIQFIQLIRTVKGKYQKGFSKEYKEMEEEKLQEEVKKYMRQYDMLRFEEDTKRYYIMPICFKVIGRYPKDFIET